MIAQAAGDKEIFAVLREADRAADASIVSRGGQHESRIRRTYAGCAVADSRDLLHKYVFVTFRIISISEDRVGHLREHEKHAGMPVAECKMPRTGAVRKADAAICIPKLSGFAVEFVDIDHVQAQVADQDFIALRMENGKVGVRSLLAVFRVKSDAPVLPGIAQ